MVNFYEAIQMAVTTKTRIVSAKTTGPAIFGSNLGFFFSSICINFECKYSEIA